jgi:putative heme transporter
VPDVEDGAEASPPRRPVPPLLDAAAALSWRALAVAAAVVVGILLLAQLYLVVLPVILALLVATLLEPVTRALQRRRVPDGLAAITVLAVALGLLVGLVVLLVPQIARELAGFAEEAEEGWEQIKRWMEFGPLGIGPEQLSAVMERIGQQLAANAAQVATGVLAGAVIALEVVVGLILTIVLTFFFLKDGERMVAWTVARAPAAHRNDLRAAGQRAWETLTGYVRGTALVAFVDAVGIGLGLLVIGVPLVLPLAVLTFFAGFFPIVGATVAGLVAVVVALVSRGLVEALLVLAVVIAVQQLESNVLEPVVLGRVLRLHPVVILASLTAGAVLAGVVGAFLAVPTAAVAASVGNELRLRREGELLHDAAAETG